MWGIEAEPKYRRLSPQRSRREFHTLLLNSSFQDFLYLLYTDDHLN